MRKYKKFKKIIEVRVKKEVVEVFKWKQGIKQGPLLFTIIVDVLIKILDEK